MPYPPQRITRPLIPCLLILIMVETISCSDQTTSSGPVINTPPFAHLVCRPTLGNLETVFEFNASFSSDAQDIRNRLQYRWDFEADGLWDAPWDTLATISHRFNKMGSYSVVVEVRDTEGMSARESELILVTLDWEYITAPVGGMTLNGVWGTSPTDVFAVGDGGTILHYNGVEWASMSSDLYHSLLGVWGTSASNVFAVGGGGRIVHYDGKSWETVHIDPTVICYRAVSGLSPSEVYAIGDSREGGGKILRYDGIDWTPHHYSIQKLNDICAVGPDDVYIAGEGGTILRLVGDAWQQMQCPTTADLHAVWGCSPENVCAAGDGETVLWFDSDTWHTVRDRSQNPPAVDSRFISIWGSFPQSMFLIHNNGDIWHRDKRHVIPARPQNHGSIIRYRDIWGCSPDELFVVGTWGQILHGRP